MKEFQNILSKMRQAVEKYCMISHGDKIAIGVSGGKDSMVLVNALSEMRKFEDYSYDIVAITIDAGFDKVNGCEYSFDKITEFCKANGITHKIVKTEIARIVFNMRKEEHPCSLCAHLRRGALFNAAEENGCTSLALAHHMDDSVETFMMNIFLQGRIGCYSPLTLYKNNGIKLIRPFIYLREFEISKYAQRTNLPVMDKICPVDGKTERYEIKNMLKAEDLNYRGLYKRILGAMERHSIDGWKS